MRAMLILVLLLAVVAMVSLYKPALVPYWNSRLPGVVAELKQGKFREAAAAATAKDPPGTVSKRWSRSEPLGEPGPLLEPGPAASPDTTALERSATDSTCQR